MVSASLFLGLPGEDAVAVAQAAVQDRLDVRLGGAIRVVVGARPLGAAGAAPAAH